MTSSITPIRASTQEHVDILDVLDDIAISKDGSCSIILQVTAINFDLLSEMEQEAIIFSYAGLLNSLTFPIQIMVRSAIKDVTNYLNLIKQQEEKQKKALLLEQLKQYRHFVETLVKDNRVLDKKFYVVIPFSSIELGLAPSLSASFTRTKSLPYPKTYIMERAKMNLYPKRDHLVRQFSRLGLICRQLTTQQIIELLYGMYNEESVGQRISSAREYAAPIVTSTLKPPAPQAAQQHETGGLPAQPPTPAVLSPMPQPPKPPIAPQPAPTNPLATTSVPLKVVYQKPASPQPVQGMPYAN